MCSSNIGEKLNISFLLLFLCLFENVFPQKQNREQVFAEYPKGCAYLHCKKGEQCVNRKFWCKNPPCPSMLYCSRSQRESLKGPSSCEAVRCSKGFVCLVRARNCRWDEECEQKIARCVSEREYLEGPASCIDYKCPSGRRCILRESLCATAPCKLLKSCAATKDVKESFEECRKLGCLSEQECFLRRPHQKCSGSSCKHKPDCPAKKEEDLETREHCRGWICPKGQECLSYTKGPCKRENCKIFRSCHKPLMTPATTTPPPENFWRDDIKLSFYSKQEKNVTSKGGLSQRSPGDKIAAKNPFSPMNKVQNEKSPNSRHSTLDANPGRVSKPTVPSLTTWLNHLKLLTSVDAIEAWIKKADKRENHEGFLEWLESVRDMLGSAAYDLWLEEVRSMTVTKAAFQKWLPASPTNRSPVSHHLARTNGNVAGGSREGREGLSGSRNSTKNSDWQETKKLRADEIHERGLGFEDDRAEKTEATPENEPPIEDYHSVSPLPGLPPTVGINDWSRLYSGYSRSFQPTYPIPSAFGPSNIGSWGNQAFPHQEFHNSGPSNPAYPQYPSNWSYQQPFADYPGSYDPRIWQDRYINPALSQWQDRNYPEEFLPGLRIPDPMNNPASILPPLEDPFGFRPRNFTNEDESWMEYFTVPYETSQFAGNLGSHPITDRNFNYPSWPDSSYRGQSLPEVPDRRSRHENTAIRNFPYDGSFLGPEKKLRGRRGNWSPYHFRFPWNPMDPGLREHYLQLRDHNRRNLYDENNQDSSKVPAGLSRTDRVNVHPRASPENSFFPDNRHRLPETEYPYKSSYPHPYPIPPIGSRETKRQTSSSPKLNPLEAEHRGNQDLFLGHRVNDVPGQTMEVPDLWSSRYRNPPSSFLRKIVGEALESTDRTERDRPSKIFPPRVFPRAYLPQEKMNDYEADGRRPEIHSAQEDDGIYPLLLSLKGYVQSPLGQVFENYSNFSNNSTILPVYTIDNDSEEEDYDEYGVSDRRENDDAFCNNEHRKQDPSDDSRNVFEAEAALLVHNETSDGQVDSEDIEWRHDYEDSNRDDNSSFWDRTQSSVPFTDGSWNDDPVHPWVVNENGAWTNEKVETDYYDERVDDVDETAPEYKGYFDPDQGNINGSLDREVIPEELGERLYDDTDHKRFKKNRPL